MPYNVDKDPYLDSSTGVLRNLLGITASDELDITEVRVTSIKMADILATATPTPTDLTPEFFLKLHQQLFGTLYDWAGQLRTVEVSKGATSFARVQYLEANLREVFAELARDNYCQNMTPDELIARLAHYYSELNVLHPFREGNGRTIRTFLSLLAASLGYYIAWGDMSASENIAACVAAYGGDEAPLEAMLARLVAPH